MNQEAFGRETSLPWGMYSANTYYTEVVDGVSRTVGPTTVHPCFLYESLWCLAGFLLLHYISRHYYRFKGQMFLCYLLWYGLGRAWIEGLRTDSLWLVENVIKVSQLLAILCVLASGALLVIGWKNLSVPRLEWLRFQPAKAYLTDGVREEEDEADAEESRGDKGE